MDLGGETTPPSVASGVRVRRLVVFSSLPFACGTLLAGTASWWWLGDVCLHFSWLAASLLVPAIVLTWRQPRWCALLLGCFLAGWWPWWQGPSGTAAPEPKGLLLAVASTNLYDFNEQRSAALDVITPLPVDLLGVQEVLPVDHARLAKHWPFAVWTQDRHLLASALLSRHPIVWSQVHDLNGFALIDALVQTPSGLLRVYVAHLASPKTPGQTAIRRQQLDQLGLLLRDSAEPMLLLGDLNLSTISPHWQRFAADANLLRPASAPTGTWPSWLGALGADIDHIAGRRLGIGAVSAFAIPGSDHRGVMATISLP